jgi:signal peptidase I
MNRRLRLWLRQYRGTVAFLLCMLVFRSAVADWNVVPTGSMQPTIRIGDRIVVDKAAYDLRLPFTLISLWHRDDPRRGDIVVLDSSTADERLVKRVIGIPGDTVAMRDNKLYVNGRPAIYTAINEHGISDDHDDPARYAIEQVGAMRHALRWSLSRPGPARDFGPVRVPPAQYLLLGDNRDNSMDSRWFGFFPRREIVGRSRYVALSLDPAHYYLPRLQRFAAALD